jgi:hypothetical protein
LVRNVQTNAVPAVAYLLQINGLGGAWEIGTLIALAEAGWHMPANDTSETIA